MRAGEGGAGGGRREALQAFGGPDGGADVWEEGSDPRTDERFEPRLLLALLEGDGWECLIKFANRYLSAARQERGELLERERAQDGEDVVSDVITDILEGKARCNGPRRFRSWVFTMVGNRARDVARRRHQRRTGSLKCESDFQDPGPGPLDVVAELEEEAWVAERIESACTPCEAEVLRLVVLDGLEPRYAAHRLRRQPGTVRCQLSKGRDKLLRSES